MGYTVIRDNAIWVKSIEGNEALRRRLVDLPGGAAIDLVVDGRIGRWEKMRDGRDGRRTDGIKPIGPMRETWTALQAERGRIVEINEVDPDEPYYAALGATLTEWDTPEDDEAYRGL